MKRTKKSEQTPELKLDIQTVKELTAKDFELVNGGYVQGRNTCTCLKGA